MLKIIDDPLNSNFKNFDGMIYSQAEDIFGLGNT